MPADAIERWLVANVADRDAYYVEAASRLPRDQPLPVTFAQERLWRHAQGDELAHGNSLTAAWSLRGPLDVGALRSALAAMTDHHEILRSTFTEIDGRPWQIVHPPTGLSFTVIDVSDERDPEAAAVRVAEHEAFPRMDLALGPLFRARLVRLSPTDHRLLLILHHLLYDSASLGVLYQEVGVLYTALAGGRGTPALEPSVQIADVAAWQRHRHRDSLRFQRVLTWWKRYWGTVPPPLDLPIRRAPGTTPTDEEGLLVADISGLADRIEALARTHGATTFIVLLAAFEVLLSRMTDRDEFVIGVDAASRGNAAAETAIGPLINLVALRADFTGTPTLSEVFARVRHGVDEALARQDLPLEELSRALSQDGLPVPHLQVIFQQIRNPQHLLHFPEIDIAAWRVKTRPSRGWDLTLAMVEGSKSLELELEYDTSRYDPEAAADLLQDYVFVLELLIDDGETAAGHRIGRDQTPHRNAIPTS